jgi:hypothetical protein
MDTIYAKGSPEAIADCQKRRRDAQRTANLIALYGACPRCNTPYISDDEPCIKCTPDESLDFEGAAI